MTAGFAREDLFCVVHEIFQTDTADYADIVLPATTQLEQVDVHISYGHLYVAREQSRDRAARRSQAEHGGVPAARGADGLRRAVFQGNATKTSRARPSSADDARVLGIDWETLKTAGWQRLALPSPYAPFAQRRLSTPSGKCEFYSAALAAQGIDPLPTFIAAARVGVEQSGAARSAIRWR